MDKQKRILISLSVAAILICTFFLAFLYRVNRLNDAWYFAVGGLVFLLNVYFVYKEKYTLAYVIFALAANALMLVFDAGYLDSTKSFVFYFPLLLSNYIFTQITQVKQRILLILFTCVSIYLTNFTTITPRLCELIYDEEQAKIVSLFNIVVAISASMLIISAIVDANKATEKKLRLKQEKLKHSQQLVNSIMHSINAGICRTHAASDRLIYVNRAKADLFGYDSEVELLKIPPSQLYANAEDREMLFAQLEEGVAVNSELQYRRKDGSLFWGLTSISKFVDEHGEVMYDAAVRDITDLRNLKQELVAAKELAEKASLAKSQFLSTMSHEIRTPMNAVIGACNLLLENESKPEKVENLFLLKSAADNLMRLINNILDFSKIESGKVEFEQMPVNLQKLITEILNTHIGEANRKHLVLNSFIDKGLNRFYIADPIRLTQVLNNLLSNAIKFTDKGEVRMDVILVENSDEKSVISFSVRDTGIGIAPEMHQKIFESFSQENVDTTRKFGGSGLGLAITRRILEKLNSSITLSSEKGKGSIFSFHLELTKTQIENPDEIKTAYYGLQEMRVLVVEDNKMNITILSKFLSKWDVVFDVAENGYTAIEQIKHHSYDLILMDLHMPGMDGYETSQAIRSINKEVPIFALTADAFVETRMKAIACGMSDFVVKPFDPQELFNKIARLRKSTLK